MHESGMGSPGSEVGHHALRLHHLHYRFAEEKLPEHARFSERLHGIQKRVQNACSSWNDAPDVAISPRSCEMSCALSFPQRPTLTPSPQQYY